MPMTLDGYLYFSSSVGGSMLGEPGLVTSRGLGVTRVAAYVRGIAAAHHRERLRATAGDHVGRGERRRGRREGRQLAGSR